MEKENAMDGKVYPSIKNSILLCLLFLGIQIGLGVIIGLAAALLGIPDASVVYGIAIGLGNLAALGIVIAIGFKKTKRPLNEVFKLNKVSSPLWVAATIFMSGFVIVLSELDNLVNYVLPMPEMLINVFDTLIAKQAFVVAIIVMGIIPGIMEELLFRGLILDGLRRNYSQKKAIITSALLFGLVHLNPWQFYSGLIIGIISAFICIKTNSITLSIYIHFFNNFLYTIAARYREIMPIKSFNTNFATPAEFQPIWFDMLGLILLIAGILLLKKGLKTFRPEDCQDADTPDAQS
jgi:membrane protease YdiL (CAAX protease family)